MSTHLSSQRSLFILNALHRRGLRGTLAGTYLRKYPHEHIAVQIDYYDHEIVDQAKLPIWAATPWLAHRIRRSLPKPMGFLPTSQSLQYVLRQIPYR